MLGGSDLGVDPGKPGPTCPAGEEVKAGRLLMGHEGAAQPQGQVLPFTSSRQSLELLPGLNWLEDRTYYTYAEAN